MCVVAYASATQIDCVLSGDLIPGPLNATVFRSGSPSALTQVAIVSGPPTIIARASNLPVDAQYIRIFGRGFGVVISELVVTLTMRSTNTSCNVISLTAPAGDSGEQSLTCTPLRGLVNEASVLASISRLESPASDNPLVGKVSAGPEISPLGGTAKIALNAVNITIVGSKLFIDPVDAMVTVRRRSTKRATGDLVCMPYATTENSISCSLNGSLSVGVLEAQILSYGSASANWTAVGEVVAVPGVRSIVSNYRIAQNSESFSFYAYDVPTSEVAISVTPYGSCENNTETPGANQTLVTCYSTPTAPIQLGPIYVSLSAFGGTSGPIRVGTVIPAPSIVSDPTKKYLTTTSTGITFTGQNLDDPNAEVVLTVNNQFDKSCVPRVNESTSTSMICDLAGGESFGNPGSLTAVVKAFGGKSTVTPVGLVEQPASSALSIGAQAGIGAGVAAFALIVIVIAIIILVYVRRRNRGMKGLAPPEIPDNMTGLFSIKAADITILNKVRCVFCAPCFSVLIQRPISSERVVTVPFTLGNTRESSLP